MARLLREFLKLIRGKGRIRVELQLTDLELSI